jgi:propanol-preferring alcohol dehydrogenase
VPKPKNNEALVKVDVCGVCRTDLHVIEGELAKRKLPVMPGHQIVGKVVSAGKDVRKLKPGDRVGITWINSTCGKCRYCMAGMENLCENAKLTGYSVDGGYAEYVTVQEDYAFPLPKGFDAAHAAPLFCAGIIGYRALKLAEVGKGKTLAIFGFGSSARIIIQIARYLGSEVVVFTRNKKHRQAASRMGAKWVGTLHASPKISVDSAIITAPVGWLVPKALDTVRKGGKVVIEDIYMSKIPEIDYNKQLYYEKSVMSVTNYTKNDIKEFRSLTAKIPIRTEIQEFPLSSANKALQLLKHDRLNGSAVLMVGAKQRRASR